LKLMIPPQATQLVAQIKANPRLQAGMALILLLLAGWILLVLGDARQARLADLEDGRERLVQVKQLAAERVWLERAEEATNLAKILSAEISPAPSPGLAQAAFQGWLREIVDSQGLPLQLSVQTPVYLDDPADVVRVTAEVRGGMDPNRVWRMIQRIEAAPSLVSIPVLNVRSDGANKTFSLTVHGYYRLPAPRPEASP